MGLAPEFLEHLSSLSPTPQEEELFSKCCFAPLNTVYSAEGTSYWECDNCLKPSEPRPPKPSPSSLPEPLEPLDKKDFIAHRDGDSWSYWLEESAVEKLINTVNLLLEKQRG